MEGTVMQVAKHIGHDEMRARVAPAVRRSTERRLLAPGTDDETALRLVGRLIELDAYLDGEAEPDEL